MQIALYERSDGALFILDDEGVVWPDMEYAPAGRAEADMKALATSELQAEDYKRFSQMEPMTWQKWQTKQEKPAVLVAIYNGSLTIMADRLGINAKQYLGKA